jgi:MBOAT, membrane-bound O-acyltransferase family
MLFSSPTFFVFFLIYFACHIVLARQYRNYLIIAGSTIFYAWWKVEYVWIPYFLMAVAFLGSVAFRHAKGSSRFALTGATIVLMFMPLTIFKYANFFYAGVLGPVFGWRGKILDATLPLGVSFVTFTLTAYVVDIYRGKFPAHNNLSTVLAYVLFFPHLIAGPILRPHELIPQLERPRSATLRRIAVPLAIFTVGLVKKLVFADQVAEVVDHVFNSGNATPSAPDALLAIYGFSLQIYCDFSGYTDMAIGLALFLGRAPAHQFFTTIHRHVVDRVLAPLAHHAVDLVARLSLHPARRKPRRQDAGDPQYPHYHGTWRVVARRKLDVCDLGSGAWNRSFFCSPEKHAVRFSPTLAAACRRADDFSFCDPGMGPVSRVQLVQGSPSVIGALHRKLAGYGKFC